MFEPLTNFFRKASSTLTKRPATSFFSLIVILFGLIVLGNYLRAPQAPESLPAQEKKETAIFNPSVDTAYLSVPAQVKKESVIHITSLTPGIITAIHALPGRAAYAGQMLIEMTNDYQSGSASLQKQIAQNNDTLTKKLASIDKRIFELKEKQTHQDDTLTSTAKKIQLKQLEEDRAQSKLNLQNSILGLSLTNVSDAVLKPKTFVTGTVESVHVRRGDFVPAGTLLVTLRATSGAATLEALVSRKTAVLFDPTHMTQLRIGNETIGLLPTYFSRSETKDGLFSILFTLSDTTKNKITNGEFLQLDIPLRSNESASFLAPIDAIFQDDNGASLLVEEDGVAETKIITLGNIYGSFAEITSGLASDAHIILNRAIVSGDSVTTR